MSGNYFTYQLMLATTDLLLHSSFDPNGAKTASDIQQQQYAKIMVRPARCKRGMLALGAAGACSTLWHLHMQPLPGLLFCSGICQQHLPCFWVMLLLLQPFAPYPGDRQINSFNHIFGGGYPAGYYRSVYPTASQGMWQPVGALAVMSQCCFANAAATSQRAACVLH